MKSNPLFSFAICRVCAFIGVLLFGLIQTPGVSLAGPLMSTWYVNAATGNDNNDCLTPTSACLTVNEAVSRAVDDDTIQIAAGVYEEELDVSLRLTLVGADQDNTFLDGDQAHRVLTASSTNLTLVDLTIRNGRSLNQNGGGIFNYGRLTLQNSQVMSNTAVNGGGGGILNVGTLILQNSRVSGNTADGVGGGFYTWNSSVMTVTESLIAENAGNQGGGLYNLGTASISDSTIRDNFAPVFGGGVTVFGGSVSLTGVTVSGNQTDGYGGGIVNNLGLLTLVNTTISGNSAPDYAGLVNISNLAQTSIGNSTVAYNVTTGSGTRYGGVSNVSDGVISLHNSIVANNSGRNCLVSGDWTSEGHNLASDSYCGFTAAGDLQNTPASLAALADYGGQTNTHALLPGSAAIDNGDNTGCPATDQRGVSRPVDGNSNGSAVCDIGAFEARRQLLVSDVTVIEGDSGTTTAVFTVTLAPTSNQAVTVDYATANGTAIAGSDYVADDGSLTFDPGEASQTVAVLVNGDSDDEPDESFTLNLTNPANADIIDAQGMATVIDDDGLPSLTIGDVNVVEGNSGTTVAQFTVSLSPADSNTVMVDFATLNGTAAAGSDYQTADDMLSFDPGQTSQLVEITIYGDVVDEGEGESFSVELANAVNANVVDNEAIGNIVDEDIARVSLDSGPSVDEGHSGTVAAVFTISLDTPTSFPVTVDYYTQSGTGGNFATPGVDFEPASGTLSFDPGETEKTVTVLIYGDIVAEMTEVFGLYLINADPISIYGSASIAYIVNDDGAPFSLYLPMVVRP